VEHAVAWNQPPLANTSRPRRHVGGAAAATVGFVATSDLCIPHADAAADYAADCAADGATDRAAPTADEQCWRRFRSYRLAANIGFAASNSERDIGELRRYRV